MGIAIRGDGIRALVRHVFVLQRVIIPTLAQVFTFVFLWVGRSDLWEWQSGCCGIGCTIMHNEWYRML